MYDRHNKWAKDGTKTRDRKRITEEIQSGVQPCMISMCADLSQVYVKEICYQKLSLQSSNSYVVLLSYNTLILNVLDIEPSLFIKLSLKVSTRTKRGLK